jgi:hypothetical protein
MFTKSLNPGPELENSQGHERHIAGIELPDPDDRHVVAAAIESGASLIVTSNIRDFPAKALKPFGLRSRAPDAFLMDLHAAVGEAIIAVAANARRNLKRSNTSPPDFIAAVRRQGLKRFADVLDSEIKRL